MEDKKRLISMDEMVPVLKERLAEGQSVRFSPRGTSMLPMIRQGRDSVVLSPVIGKLKRGDIPLYRRDNGSYVLHRIDEAGETYTCIGDHQFVLEHGIRQDQVIAVVTEFYRGNRRCSTKNVGYRAYCALWRMSRPARFFVYRAYGWLRRHIGKKEKDA